MINISSTLNLGIITPNKNKALAHVLNNATQSELETISLSKDLKSVLNSILKKSTDSNTTNKELLNLLKNNPTLKNLGNVSTTIKDLLTSLKSDTQELPLEKKLKNFLTDIKDLKNSQLKEKFENSGIFLESKLKNVKNPQTELKNILIVIAKELGESPTTENKKLLQEIKKLLTNEILKSSTSSDIEKNMLTNPNELKKISSSIQLLTQNLKTAINSADSIFNPSIAKNITKLELLNTPQSLNPQNNVKEIIKYDLKAMLLQASQEIKNSSHPNQNDLLKHIDKLSLQIDNYQLLSHLSNGTSLFLPFEWDALENGNIEMKKDDEKFYCDIHLQLKEYGEINLKLTLYEKNQLNLHLYSRNEKFKSLVHENISSLRQALIDAKITPREIRIFDLQVPKVNSPYQEANEKIHLGFELKA